MESILDVRKIKSNSKGSMEEKLKLRYKGRCNFMLIISKRPHLNRYK
jgi:hypothetical protein